MIQRPDFIIIGSTGRNTGKTEFACRLIERYAKTNKIYGVKVVTIDPDEGNCPRGGKGCGVCTSLKKNFEIIEENQILPGKDTSRMLAAGAIKVFMLKVNQHALEEGINAFIKLVPDDTLVVCESNSVRKVVDPGLFLVIKNVREKRIKESCAEVIDYADKVIDFLEMNWNFSPERIYIRDNSWQIRENATAIILAGGKSTRMGGEDKSLLPVNGIPLIEHISNQLKGHFDEVLIGANDPEKYSFLHLRVVPDIEAGKGPLMGILSCLDASDSELNFITACDIPEMNIKLIRRMINLASDADIVMPVSETDKYEPLYAIYRKSVAGFARKVLGNNKRRIIELFDYTRVTFTEFKEDDWYQNINLKEDYDSFVKKRETRQCDREDDDRFLAQHFV